MFEWALDVLWQLWCALMDYVLYFCVDWLYARKRINNRPISARNGVWRRMSLFLLILSVPVALLHHIPYLLWLLSAITLLITFRHVLPLPTVARVFLNYLGAAVHGLINALGYLYRLLAYEERNHVPPDVRHLTRQALHSDSTRTSGYGSPNWSQTASPLGGFATSTPVDHRDQRVVRRVVDIR